MVNPIVFMDIQIRGAPAGRIVYELYADVTPRTAENFRALCTGERGIGKNGKPLHYKGCDFYRSEKYIMAYGNGESIYGRDLEAENFIKKHTGPRILSTGCSFNHNHSTFLITTSAKSDWDGKSVVFGEVVDGMDVVHAIHRQTHKSRDAGVVIADCGQLNDDDGTSVRNPKVFMDIKIGVAPAGRIVYELYANITPRTAENFRALCTGEKGIGKNGQPLHFKGCDFYRSEKYIMVYGNGESIYGGDLEAENFIKKHTGPGILSTGCSFNHNHSIFLITTSAKSDWDGKSVVFGEVVDGMDVVHAIHRQTHKSREAGVIIADCGQLNDDDEEEEEEEEPR